MPIKWQVIGLDEWVEWLQSCEGLKFGQFERLFIVTHLTDTSLWMYVHVFVMIFFYVVWLKKVIFICNFVWKTHYFEICSVLFHTSWTCTGRAYISHLSCTEISSRMVFYNHPDFRAIFISQLFYHIAFCNAWKMRIFFIHICYLKIHGKM